MTLSRKFATASKHAPRILVRATNWIGDSVMSMPAVQRLREMEPNAHIALLCHAKLHDLWRHNPFVNEVIPFDPVADASQLRQQRFDVAILFPNSFRTAWEAWRARIPCRVGFEGHWRKHLLTDVVHEPESEQPRRKPVTVNGTTFQVKYFPSLRHQSERYLDIISYMGGNREFVQPRIWLAPSDVSDLTQFVREDSRPFIGINAGAEYGPAKRWMPERFAETAARVAEDVPCRWLLFGGAADVPLAAEIETQMRATITEEGAIVNMAGKTTLMELCQLIKICRLVLTNDTGPMHLADALGTPAVAIVGSTSAELTGPMLPLSRVVHEPVECSPCFLRECPVDFRCMDRITVDRVVQTMKEAWDATGKARSHS